MKDLTNTEKQQLLGKIKSFLNITWEDQDTNTELMDMIYSGINRLDQIAGAELYYLITPQTEGTDKTYNVMSYLAFDLLKNRVFYQREKALDDFEKNYSADILSLYTYGKVYKHINANK